MVELVTLVDIVPRAEWNVPEPPSTRRKMPRPCGWLTVHHEGGSMNISPYGDDLAAVLAWGKKTGRTWEYNYVVTPDGGVYEWGGDYMAAHSAGENDEAYGVLLLDNYNNTSFPDAALGAFRRLVAELKNRGQLTHDVRLTPHKDMPDALTSCPGSGVMARWADLVSPWVVLPPTPSEEDDMRYRLFAPHGFYDTLAVGPGNPFNPGSADAAQELVNNNLVNARDGSPFPPGQPYPDAIVWITPSLWARMAGHMPTAPK